MADSTCKTQHDIVRLHVFFEVEIHLLLWLLWQPPLIFGYMYITTNHSVMNQAQSQTDLFFIAPTCERMVYVVLRYLNMQHVLVAFTFDVILH